jgi:putative copper resistance protein D
VCFLRTAPVGSAWLSMVIAVMAGLLLATLSSVGHTQIEQGFAGGLHVGMDALHLLAAGAWLGGLVGLVVTLRDPYADQRSTILMRFSRIGLLAVATLIMTGLVNSWFLVATIDNLWTSRYGELLILKLAAFFSMVALAGANRFWLLPAMEGMLHPKSQSARLRQLKRHVYAELGLGTVVLMMVGVLGTLQPAGAH